MNESRTTAILPAVPDASALESTLSHPLSFDAALQRLHEADRALDAANKAFRLSMESAARALAPFDAHARVRANQGRHKGRTFDASDFSIEYADASCRVAFVTASGPLEGRSDAAGDRGHWQQRHSGLLAWAHDDDVNAAPPDIQVPPAARAEVRIYAKAMDALRQATEHSRYCHRMVLMTPEIVEYVKPVKPGEEGDVLNPGGWRNLFNLRVKLERVHLKSRKTSKPWNPADLAWVAQGKLISSGGRELGVSLEWAGNVSSLRAGAERKSWQRARELSAVKASTGYVMA